MAWIRGCGGRRSRPWPWLAVLAVGVALVAVPVQAARVVVAVASNFTPVMERLVPLYERDSGDTLVISAGSTGKHYAQIRNGAPFHVFLAADERRPALLEERGLTGAGTRFTYARGRLALLFADIPLPESPLEHLRDERVHRVAIANPRTAPYGRAARQMMASAELGPDTDDRLVMGENIGQAFQFVITGNAQAGFVAWSQIVSTQTRDRAWRVPETLHEPIRQQAVLLRDVPAARRFLAFLRGERAAAVIREFGYQVPVDG